MAVEEIQKIINKSSNRQSNAEALLVELINCPHVERIRYTDSQTFFHLLVNKKKDVVLEFILKNGTFNHIALIPDERESSILCYAIMQDDVCLKTLNLILTYLPDLINRIDLQGNTALHLAIMHRKIEAIKALRKTEQVDVDLPNQNGDTPATLAGNDPELIRAMMHNNLSTETPPQAVSNKKRPNSNRTSTRAVPLRSTFWKERSKSIRSTTFLVSPEHLTTSLSPLAASSADVFAKTKSPHRLRSSSHEAFENSAITKDPIKIQQGLFKRENYKNYPESLFLMLLDVAKDGIIQAEDLSLVNKFIEICLCYPFLSTNETLKNTLFSKPANFHVLSYILKQLQTVQPLMAQQLDEYQNRIKFMTWNFEEQMNKSSSSFASSSSDIIAPTSPDLIQSLWITIVGRQEHTIDNNGEKNKSVIYDFNYEMATQRIVGLNTIYPFEQIIEQINLLFPTLNNCQRLNANYLVWQMIIHDPTSLETKKDWIKKFKRVNKKSHDGLGKAGTFFNEKLFDLEEFVLQRAPLIRNVLLFQKWLHEAQFVEGKKDLDSVISSALRKKTGQRDREVSIICDELINITLSLFQRVTLRELGVGCYDNKEITPNIVAYTEFKNKLISYMVNKILNEPEGKQTNAIKFMLELAQHLYKPRATNQLDLNSLSLIVGVLNINGISRLKEVFAALSTSEKELLAKINKLVRDNNGNNVLPEFGSYQTQITRNKETTCSFLNREEIDRAEIQGKILGQFHLIQSLIQSQFVCFRTNMNNFIAQFNAPSESILDLKSFRLRRRPTDVVNLTDSELSPIQLLAKINTELLENGIIPYLQNERKDYPPDQFAIVLVNWFIRQWDVVLHEDPVSIVEFALQMNNAIQRLNIIGEGGGLYALPIIKPIIRWREQCKLSFAKEYHPVSSDAGHIPLFILRTLSKEFLTYGIIPREKPEQENTAIILLDWFELHFNNAINSESEYLEELIKELDLSLHLLNNISKLRKYPSNNPLIQAGKIKEFVERAGVKSPRLNILEARQQHFFSTALQLPSSAFDYCTDTSSSSDYLESINPPS